MKPENLHRALREWEIHDRLPPRFQERVWQRIAREEAQTLINPWSLFSNWLGQLLARPSMAVSYLVLLLFSGLLAGYWQARVEQTHTLEQLGSRYVQMLDPYHTQH